MVHHVHVTVQDPAQLGTSYHALILIGHNKSNLVRDDGKLCKVKSARSID